MTDTLSHVDVGSRQRRRRRRRGRHLPRQPPDLHRRGDLRARDEAHLRGQLDLPGPREPGAQPRRLLHHLHRPPAGGDHPQTRTASCNCLINACAHRGAMICRRKTDNRMTLTCPFHGWTFRNDGTLLKVKDPDGAGYPRPFDVDGSPQHDQGGAVRELPRLPVRQPQRRRAAAGRAPRRHHEGDRHAGRPVPRRPGGAARLVDLHLRRQLEGAGGERRRRLPRHRHALELRRHDRRAAAPASRRTTPRPSTPAAGASPAAATGPTPTATCACGPGPATRRTGRCGTSWTS